MKKLLLAFAIGVTTMSAAMATDVGVSVGISQPGLYGRIDIGSVPQPRVIYQQPVIIQQSPAVVEAQPIYLRVPPGHEKHWGKHCRKYGACGQPVYFVQERWYQQVYVPQVQRAAYVEQRPVYVTPQPVQVMPAPVYVEGGRGGHKHGHGHGHGRGKGRGHD